MEEFLRFVLHDPAASALGTEREKLIRLLDSFGVEGISACLRKDAKLAIDFRSLAQHEVLVFVENEIRRLKSLKDRGTITQEELDYARNELQSLLSSIDCLCGTTSS